jgi:hypothetical protein
VEPSFFKEKMKKIQGLHPSTKPTVKSSFFKEKKQKIGPSSKYQAKCEAFVFQRKNQK